MTKISIALCTYNGAEFLGCQLKSFQGQTRLPDELIVCDDGSRDETLKILSDFAAESLFPVKIFVNETNLGSTKNFEKAISLCGGDVILLSDQDDFWQPQKIERLTREFEKDEAIGMVFSNAEITDAQMRSLDDNLWDFTFPRKSRRLVSDKQFFETLLSQNVVTGATMAFRAKYRNMFSPIPETIPNMIHDAWIALSIAAVAKTVFIDENLIKYRQHSSQQLGINLEDSRPQSYSRRRAAYAKFVNYYRDEIARLRHLEKLIPSLKQFENYRRKIDFEKIIEDKKNQIEHYERRGNLSENALRRALEIGGELTSGRYHSFSKGFLSAAKDLLKR